ncbi:MAG: hypothetical protein EOP49_26880 [Sphingobacteriales bacterium]|nr:MAG: hypothetical protein EOP49_26880 [Sphingobacteriales bacterium]
MCGNACYTYMTGIDNKDQEEPSLPDGDIKDTLSQQDMQEAGKGTAKAQPRKALETPDGKNNGAEPPVFKNERKYRT